MKPVKLVSGGVPALSYCEGHGLQPSLDLLVELAVKASGCLAIWASGAHGRQRNDARTTSVSVPESRSRVAYRKSCFPGSLASRTVGSSIDPLLPGTWQHVGYHYSPSQ